MLRTPKATSGAEGALGQPCWSPGSRRPRASRQGSGDICGAGDNKCKRITRRQVILADWCFPHQRRLGHSQPRGRPSDHQSLVSHVTLPPQDTYWGLTPMVGISRTLVWLEWLPDLPPAVSRPGIAGLIPPRFQQKGSSSPWPAALSLQMCSSSQETCPCSFLLKPSVCFKGGGEGSPLSTKDGGGGGVWRQEQQAVRETHAGAVLGNDGCCVSTAWSYWCHVQPWLLRLCHGTPASATPTCDGHPHSFPGEAAEKTPSKTSTCVTVQSWSCCVM